MMTGTEAAVQDANKHEAIQKKEEREQDILQRTEKVRINNELLPGTALEKDFNDDNDNDNSDSSEVREVVFSTLISPSQPMLSSARSTTPEKTKKRSFTLVDRTPEKPRAAPATPTTPSVTIIRKVSPVASTTLESTGIPVSTAPARLDGRSRREGKNTAYLEAMAIECTRGRSGRGGRVRRGERA